MAKKVKTYLVPYTENYLYGMNYHENVYNACQHGSDCCDGDYCRCGEIESIELDPIQGSSILSMAKENIEYHIGHKLSVIEQYVVERYLSLKVRDEDDIEWQARGGYYGAEMDSIKLNNPELLWKNTKMLLELPTDVDRVKAVLELEYGSIADTISDKNKVEVQKIKLGDIVIPNQKRYQFVSKESKNVYDNRVYYKFWDDAKIQKGKRKINVRTERYELTYDMPIAVVRMDGDKLVLVDGYTRLGALNKVFTEDKIVSVLVLSHE